jgi:AcrR family transcriptional regulator
MRAPERRTSILRAAFGAFAEHGYLGTSTRDLARAAGVTEVTLFRHFPTKEALFRAAVAEVSTLAQASPLPLEGDEPPAALFAAGLAIFRLLGENRGVLRIMLGEAGRHPQVGAAIFAEVERTLVHPLEQAIARWQEARALRPGSPALLARAFLGMFFYFFLTEAILRRREITAARQSRVVREFVSLFLEGKKP